MKHMETIGGTVKCKRHAKHLLKQVDGDFEGYAARCFGF